MLNLNSLKEKQESFDLANKEVNKALNKRAKAHEELEKAIYDSLLEFSRDDIFQLQILKAKNRHGLDEIYLTLKGDFSPISKHEFAIYLDEDCSILADYNAYSNIFKFLFRSLEQAISFAKENKLKISTQSLLEELNSLKERATEITNLISQIEKLC